MLSDEERESLRQLTDGVSSTLKDDEREDHKRYAAQFLSTLHEFGCDDDSAGHVARLIARLMASLQTTSLQNVSDVIDANLTTYIYVAAGAAGLLGLPDVKTAPRDDAPNAPTGMYL